MRTRLILAAAISVVANAAVAAGSYSGNWPITVSHSEYNNGSLCLTLTDNGSDGWPHSGPASVSGVDGTYSGFFEIVGKMLLVSIEDGGDYMNAGTVYAAGAHGGTIGNGAFSEIYDGESLDTGELAFGAKGGC